MVSKASVWAFRDRPIQMVPIKSLRIAFQRALRVLAAVSMENFFRTRAHFLHSLTEPSACDEVCQGFGAPDVVTTETRVEVASRVAKDVAPPLRRCPPTLPGLVFSF